MGPRTKKKDLNLFIFLYKHNFNFKILNSSPSKKKESCEDYNDIKKEWDHYEKNKKKNEISYGKDQINIVNNNINKNKMNYTHILNNTNNLNVLNDSICYEEKNGKDVKSNIFFHNDFLIYKNIKTKVCHNKKNEIKYISKHFFYHLNKYHKNIVNSYFKECFYKYTKTSKIFFGVLLSFSILLSLFLVTSSNFLEYNIILKYHIKFHSLLFAFFSSYYLGLQIANYYFINNIHNFFSSFFFLNSISSIYLADYYIWASYYFLSFNYLIFLLFNYYNMYYRNVIPKFIFKNVNKIFLFSLFSNYLAINKGKFIEKNIDLLKNEDTNTSFWGLLKILPYFL
ncbi:conserved Plasmodium membrane protein, unknown function [Plasmodium sp. gorilla clade G2]|uniref:conserved Plasmodium membrane protein, unknown function n=1 Tax=Plasmodium sp. gorilla clade G2 TaxID=880535 RepID=UPI000D229F3E|nr:conserved Plasmodium membrane protein, unknown function [Plasmodium sp. gorilla clade G2]SOV12664.1 conserved Plasmodium membrane protein, unknown function [Plasmodium sp. gorilla clade G2]